MNASKLLVLGAVICFTLATFGGALPFAAPLIPLGLALLAASFLV